VVTAAAALLYACVTNPATGRSQLILLSEREEITIGREADPDIRAEYGVYEDERLAGLLDSVGTSLASRSERPGLPFQFTLLDSPIVNAFALPGGPVYATRGLLAHAQDEAELAGVLGHEIGHVIARHGAEQMSRARVSQLGLGVLAVARPEYARYADLLGAGAGLLLLSYGRDAEREADRLGVRYLGLAGYDPFGLPRYLGVLDTLADDRGSLLPGWLSTHPDPGARVKATSSLAAPVLERLQAAGTEPRRAASAFRASLDGLVYGENPREGFERGRTFHHPDLRFRYELPEGWVTRNTRSLVVSLDAAENPTARLILRLVPPADAEGRTPDQYAAQLSGRLEGERLVGAPLTINGLAAWLGQLVPATGEPRSLVAWVRHDGRLYELAGGWASAAGTQVRAALEHSIRSFAEETDPEVLAVQPSVLRVERAGTAGTLRAVCDARRADLAAACEEVGRLNRMDLDEPLEPNRQLKLPLRER
jgi:predicted Zn-dependent protease